MSTVKISQLSEITHLNTNTANTLIVGVDIPTGVTGKITATTLAEGLFSFNPLNVGNNHILFDHTVGQFSGNDSVYLQVNLQNFNGSGSGDYIVTANTGTNSNSYIDMGMNGSQFSDSNYSAMKPYDGYLYVMGPNDTSSQGNLVIGTASSNANVSVIVGGTTSSNLVLDFTKTGVVLQSSKTITFGDGSNQSVAASPANYTQSAFDKANTVNAYAYSANTWLQANTGSALAASKVYTDSANSYIQSHYLANTSGTFNGNLNIAGTANVGGGRLIVANSSYDTANTALVSITGSPGGVTQPPPQPGYMLDITGLNGIPSRVVNNAYGTNTFALFGGRKANGTASSPTAAANNDVICRFGSSGHNGTSFAIGGQSRIDFIAAENYTTTNTGSRIEIWNTPIGSNVINKIASFNGNSAEFSGVISPQKGFIFTPNVISSNVTTIGIDVANNSLYKLSCNNDISLSLSNFQTGKVVEVWLTNYSGSNRTVTHGCSGINSTVNSPTFTITATSSAYLRYFSIDGDLANTYVTVQHA